MPLPIRLFSSAFREQRLGLMLSLLIGIMVYLGSLAMAAQAVLARTSVVWGHDLQSRLTIELPSAADEPSEKREDRAQKVVAALMKEPEITEVKLLPESETARLLGPWIADPSLLSSLALPRLVDIDVALGQTLDEPRLREILKPVAPEAMIHKHERGLTELLGFLKGLGALAWLMLGLTGAALVAIIGLICRAALAIQHDTVELLHYMGATDAIIARQFQAHVRRLAFPSALVGFFAAAATIGLLVLLIGSLGALSLIAPVSWVTVGALTASVPVAAALLAIASSRFFVQRFLRRLA